MPVRPASSQPDPADKNGFEVATDKLGSFANVMTTSAVHVNQIKAATPRFESWNLVPVAGIPSIGLLYVNRLNTISDVWADCAGVLKEVLEVDGGLLVTVAGNYRAAEEKSRAAASNAINL
ncbi:hypothetical protein IMZ11_08875 [Microtetraspora sp. AC03309]|uniref:hypothetical protein n=1 Tax=Microtetraspora sp. AC03309 TaxID=2779376 RepID=UPI001E2F126F|nr:hypothetical protein [Microtetraspora sp. AC03309]MCC5575751.1 hypothetical protein [Microtetraspora sp. AC03309]